MLLNDKAAQVLKNLNKKPCVRCKKKAGVYVTSTDMFFEIRCSHCFAVLRAVHK